MPQFAYTSVGVNLKEFMAGKNPTTQPGVQVSYYTSMAAAMENTEFEFDGKNSTSCIMMFDVSTIKTKLMPSPNPNILGRGTITPQHVVNAMIEIRQSGQQEPLYVDAGQCDWNQARATIQFIQEKQQVPQHPLVATSLRWDKNSFAADALRYAEHAMQQAEGLGVPAEEMGITGSGDEPNNDEPDEEI